MDGAPPLAVARALQAVPFEPPELVDSVAEAIKFTEKGHVLVEAQGEKGEPTGAGAGGSAATTTRALLVEDNMMNQVVAQKMLCKLSCTVDVAVNGVEALSMLERFRYDIIFMDCQMPEMDGYEATREIRRREGGGPRLPIVGVTAHAMAGDRERCLAAGMDDYLTKPVTLEAFRSMIRKWLNIEPVVIPGGGKQVAQPVAPAAPAHTMPAPVTPAPVTPAPVAAAPVASGPLDERRLGQLTALPGGDVLLKRLIGRFLETTGADIAKIEAAAGAREAIPLRNAAHGLRGACLNLGIQALAAVLARVEELANAGDLDGAVAATADLPAEVARAREALEAYLARLPASAGGPRG